MLRPSGPVPPSEYTNTLPSTDQPPGTSCRSPPARRSAALPPSLDCQNSSREPPRVEVKARRWPSLVQIGAQLSPSLVMRVGFSVASS